MQTENILRASKCGSEASTSGTLINLGIGDEVDEKPKEPLLI